MWKLLGLQISKGQMNIIHGNAFFFFFSLIYRMRQILKTQIASTKQLFTQLNKGAHQKKTEIGASWASPLHSLLGLPPDLQPPKP